MSDVDREGRAAQFLVIERRALNPFGPIPEAYAPRNLGEAYAMQDELARLLVATHGPVAGYKIALTTQAAQQFVGYHEPLAGSILSRTIYQSPHILTAVEYIKPSVECEIAVQLGKALPPTGAPWSRAQVTDAVDAVMVAFELVDDRNADYSLLATQILTGVADNIWNAGVILGAPVQDWRSLDLAEARGMMRMNGKVVGEGYGRDVMGHPFEALTRLANILATRGKSLDKGMVVVTGSFVALEYIHPGDTVEATIEGLGEVRLNVV